MREMRERGEFGAERGCVCVCVCESEQRERWSEMVCARRESVCETTVGCACVGERRDGRKAGVAVWCARGSRACVARERRARRWRALARWVVRARARPVLWCARACVRASRGRGARGEREERRERDDLQCTDPLLLRVSDTQTKHRVSN